MLLRIFVHHVQFGGNNFQFHDFNMKFKEFVAYEEQLVKYSVLLNNDVNINFISEIQVLMCVQLILSSSIGL